MVPSKLLWLQPHVLLEKLDNNNKVFP